MTAHERHLDETCREKIERGIEGISKAPMRLGSGPAFNFDAATDDMTYIGEAYHDIHLLLYMGAPQVWMETADMLDHTLFKDMRAEYGHAYLMTDEENARLFTESTPRASPT